jgi:N-methylhydantoinase B
LSCANVEWFEMNFPVLYLFRRHARNAAGPGKFRGGAGAETAHILHDAPEGKVKGITYGVSGSRNSGQGIFGGHSALPSIVLHVEETEVEQVIKQKRPIEDISDLGGRASSLAYKEFEFKKNDVVYMRVASGGGYGDPLEREPQRVLADVIDGIVSEKVARDIYGVVLEPTGQAVDSTATEDLRATLRNSR